MIYSCMEMVCEENDPLFTYSVDDNQGEAHWQTTWDYVCLNIDYVWRDCVSL